MTRHTLSNLLALALTSVAASSMAQSPEFGPAERLLQLSRVPGVSGHEADVRHVVATMLPGALQHEVDNLGNLLVRVGSGSPRTLVVAALDEPGYVVSGITEEGYLRLHLPTAGLAHPLSHEYHVGQPVLIRSARGGYVQGVTATPSLHLRSTRPPGADARPQTLDDLFVDVGAADRDEAASLGIRMLDPVTLRERTARLAGGYVAGVAVSARGGATALLEIANRLGTKRPHGSVILAWTAQSFFGQRGLRRLIETEKPDRVIAFAGALAPARDATGSTGVTGGGPLVREADGHLASVAATLGVEVQKRSDAELPFFNLRDLETHVIGLPSRYAQTPVETVDAGDVETAALLAAAAAGLSPLGPPSTLAAVPEPPPVAFVEPDLQLLAGLVRAYGVSTHEAPVRAEVLRRLPAWARPEVDKKGNVIVRMGQGGTSLLFVAHTDEVGFEIASINDDGTAAVRSRGGMFLSLYEAHPVVVHTEKGPRPAVLAPRRNYASATTLEPELSALVLDVGAGTGTEAKALGFEAGQSLTPRKDLARLGEHRAAARAMDDRNGSAALLQALSRLDPETLQNRVTFAWSVEEETGLAGAAFMAASEEFDTVFAVDTFVSSDTPVDSHRTANAPLGQGAVLRGLDNRTLVPADVMDRITMLARNSRIPLQIGTTGGGTDASPFSARGSVDVGLSWPGRYSHSAVEVMDRRDLESLTRLIVTLAREY